MPYARRQGDGLRDITQLEQTRGRSPRGTPASRTTHLPLATRSARPLASENRRLHLGEGATRRPTRLTFYPILEQLRRPAGQRARARRFHLLGVGPEGGEKDRGVVETSENAAERDVPFPLGDVERMTVAGWGFLYSRSRAVGCRRGRVAVRTPGQCLAGDGRASRAMSSARPVDAQQEASQNPDREPLHSPIGERASLAAPDSLPDTRRTAWAITRVANRGRVAIAK